MDDAIAAATLTIGPKLTYDPTAGVYELFIVTEETGEREWIGAYDTPEEARDAYHRWISSGQ